MNVRLRIDRLVLDGYAFGPRDRVAFQGSLERELGRLLTAGGMSADLGGGIAVPSVRVPGLAGPGAAPDASSTQLGVSVARSVYGGIGE